MLGNRLASLKWCSEDYEENNGVELFGMVSVPVGGWSDLVSEPETRLYSPFWGISLTRSLYDSVVLPEGKQHT